MNDRVFDAQHAARLRSPERLARLRLPDVLRRVLTPGLRVALDVGTGSGLLAEALLQAGIPRVIGLDRSPVMLAELRAAVPAVEPLQAPADAVPLADASVDLVLAGFVLHEVPDPLAALKEWRRLARRSVAVLEWPHREDGPRPLLAHRLDPERVQDWARAAGLGEAEAWDGGTVVLWTWTLPEP
ncbi:MAG TPA: class I SAM-dependent methyltransferase [Deinococcales bacterium]|nr:class I SAM-dependent methyltransferase [Deinococcales bacterium]